MGKAPMPRYPSPAPEDKIGKTSVPRKNFHPPAHHPAFATCLSRLSRKPVLRPPLLSRWYAPLHLQYTSISIRHSPACSSERSAHVTVKSSQMQHLSYESYLLAQEHILPYIPCLQDKGAGSIRDVRYDKRGVDGPYSTNQPTSSSSSRPTRP